MHQLSESAAAEGREVDETGEPSGERNWLVEMLLMALTFDKNIDARAYDLSDRDERALTERTVVNGFSSFLCAYRYA